MDFSIVTRLDMTRLNAAGDPDTAPGNWNSQHGIMLDIPGRNRVMYGFIRDRIKGEHCGGPHGTPDELTGQLGEFPWTATFRIDKIGTSGEYRWYYRFNDTDPWVLDHSIGNSEQPISAGLHVKNWGGGGSPHTITNFDYACITGTIYPAQELACAVNDASGVDLSWVIPPDADWTGIRILREGAEIATLDGDVTSYTDDDPQWDGGYEYRTYTVEVTSVTEYVASASCDVERISEDTVVFRDGEFPTPDYTACEDAHIIYHRSDHWDPVAGTGTQYNSGAHDALEEGDWNGGHGDHKEILIQFTDLSALDGLAIASAELRMWYWYCRDGGNVEHRSFAHVVKREWNEGRGGGVDGAAALEGEVTWQSAQFGIENWWNWDEQDQCENPVLPAARAGGAYGSDDIQILNIESNELYGNSGQKWVTWDVTLPLQRWLDGTWENHGLKVTQQAPIHGNSPCGDYVDGGYDFVSSNHSAVWARPTLVVRFIPFTCPTGFACDVAGHDITVSWTNEDDYDSLTLTVENGPVAVPPVSVDPTEESTTLTLPSGTYDLTLTAVKGENSCDLECQETIVLACPSDITCDVSENDITVNWTNNDPYTQIVVQIDGADVDTLAGNVETYTANDLDVGTHQICIVASDEGSECDPLCCDPDPEILPAPMNFIRGDANADGGIDIADPVKILEYYFAQGSILCDDAADVNDDGAIDIADPIALLDYIFGVGSIPPPNQCGVDPTSDALGCGSFPPCPQGW
jgi:hypothetical protein